MLPIVALEKEKLMDLYFVFYASGLKTKFI